jgi:hypothetical protein
LEVKLSSLLGTSWPGLLVLVAEVLISEAESLGPNDLELVENFPNMTERIETDAAANLDAEVCNFGTMFEKESCVPVTLFFLCFPW